MQSARELGDPSFFAKRKLALAQAQLEAGDAAAGLKTSIESQELSARIGTPEIELMALLTAARNSRSLHDYAKPRITRLAQTNYSRVFQQLWGADNYNSYLNRPDIKVSRTQLNELLAQKN